MPKGRGFLGCSQRTRHATPKGERCDRLTRALVAWLSPPLHRRRFPQALRYVDSLAHGEPERPSSPALKGGVFWRRKITASQPVPSGSRRSDALCYTPHQGRDAPRDASNHRRGKKQRNGEEPVEKGTPGGGARGGASHPRRAASV